MAAYPVSRLVNNTRHDESFRQVHGATYRHLLDLADWDRGLATSAPGQSGQPGSPHYADLLPLWARGEYFPLVFSRAACLTSVTTPTTRRPPSSAIICPTAFWPGHSVLASVSLTITTR